jgi:hypothetical protein
MCSGSLGVFFLALLVHKLRVQPLLDVPKSVPLLSKLSFGE